MCACMSIHCDYCNKIRNQCIMNIWTLWARMHQNRKWPCTFEVHDHCFFFNLATKEIADKQNIWKIQITLIWPPMALKLSQTPYFHHIWLLVETIAPSYHDNEHYSSQLSWTLCSRIYFLFLKICSEKLFYEGWHENTYKLFRWEHLSTPTKIKIKGIGVFLMRRYD